MQFEESQNQLDVDETREEMDFQGTIITRSIRTARIRKEHTSASIKYRQVYRS